MTRRRIIWALVAFVVTFTIGMLLGATEARADTASPSAHDATMTLGAAVLLVVGMAVFALLCVGALYLIEALRERWRRISADMDALIEATHECPPNGPCAWCVSRVGEKRNGPPKRAVEPADQPPAGMSTSYDAKAMVDKLRGEDRIGRMVRETETELCEQLWAMPTANEPRRTT